MKQLIHASGSSLIVALGDHAFVLTASKSQTNEAVVLELLVSKPDATRVQNGDIEDEDEGEDPKDSDPLLNTTEVQAVALSDPKEGGTVKCAVARADKTIALYEFVTHAPFPENTSSIQPYLVHNANKRVSSLIFLTVGSSSTNIDVVLAGDVIGDVYAFPTLIDSHKDTRRFMLGHTASMITSIRLVTYPQGLRKILSADRDEKIRISSFPNTTVIDGYLLGHSQFISDMDVTVLETSKKYLPIVLGASCSGDGTVRLWDIQHATEVAKLGCSKPKTSTNETEQDDPNQHNESVHPAKLSLSPSATLLALIYHATHHLDMIRITDDSPVSMKIIQSIRCKHYPIDLKFVNDNSLFVLMNGPGFLSRFERSTDGSMISMVSYDDCSICHALTVRTDKVSIAVSSESLALDKVGRKSQEAKDVSPWLRSERVQVVKQRIARRRKRAREKSNPPVHKRNST